MKSATRFVAPLDFTFYVLPNSLAEPGHRAIVFRDNSEPGSGSTDELGLVTAPPLGGRNVACLERGSHRTCLRVKP